MSSPVVVLLHGAAANGRVFDPVVEQLPGVPVVAPSYPGRCGEDGPLLRDIDLLVDWTTSWLLGHGHWDVLLVGHSLGTAVAVGVAWQLLRLGQGQVRALVLLSTPTRPAAVAAVAGIWSTCVAQGDVTRARAMGFLPGTPEHHVQRAHDVEALTPLPAVAADWDVARSIGDRLPPPLPLPFHFVSGTMDRLSPIPDLETWAARLPDARVEAWPGVGHRLDVTEPQRIAQTIRNVLQGA